MIPWNSLRRLPGIACFRGSCQGNLYLPAELDALASAFTAWLVSHHPERTLLLGDPREGQIALPVNELKRKYSLSHKMPDLAKSLQGRDIGFIRIVADLWGIALKVTEPRAALPALAAALHDRALVSEVVEALPATARQALEGLALRMGACPGACSPAVMAWCGEFGPAKRDREQPYLSPISPAEVLWYPP